MECQACQTANHHSGAFCTGCGAVLRALPPSEADATARPLGSGLLPWEPEPVVPEPAVPGAAPAAGDEVARSAASGRLAWEPEPVAPADASAAAGGAAQPPAGGQPSWAPPAPTRGLPVGAARVGAARDLASLGLVDAMLLPFQQADALTLIGIGALVNLVPLLGAIVLAGYATRWTRRLLAGTTRELPAWEGWGELFWDGMWSTTVFTAFSLVPAVALVIWAASSFISMVSSGLLVKLDSGDPSVVFGALVALAISAAGHVILGMLLVLLCSMPGPIATCHYARTGEVLGALRPAVWWPIMLRGLGELIGAWCGLLGAGMAVSFALLLLNAVPVLGTLASMVGWLALPVLSTLSGAAVFTRYYLRHLQDRYSL